MADYVNPFGGYAQGYTQGSELEDRLQQNARQARQADWENRYINPDKAQQSHVATREAQAQEPYYNQGLQPALDALKADSFMKQLGAGTQAADITGNAVGVQNSFLKNYGQNTGATDADIVGAVRLPAAENFALGLGRNQALQTTAGARGEAADASMQRALYPVAPAPAAGGYDYKGALNPFGTPAVPAAGATPAPPPEGSDAPGVNPQGSAITPFHQLDPMAQAHAIHYTSQLTGHPPEAVAQHIASQMPRSNFSTDQQTA